MPMRQLAAGPVFGLIAKSIAGYRAPDVFEDFMSLEKVGAVEEIDTSVEVPVVGRHGHSGSGFY